MNRRTKIVAIAAILIVYVLIVWWWTAPAPRAQRLPEWTPEEKQYVVQRMEYHGIDGCVQDKTGYYFYRDGKRCKL
jgi:hypothetical protein